MSVVQGNIELSSDFLQTLGLPRDVAVPASVQVNRAFSNGTGTSQVNGVAPFSVTLAGGASTDVDLQSMSDMEGALTVFAEVRAIILYASASNALSVHLEQSALAPWTTGLLLGTSPIIPITANGVLTAISPKAGTWTVSALSKGIKLTNQSPLESATVSGYFLGVLA